MIKGPTNKPGTPALRSTWWISFFRQDYLKMFKVDLRQTRQEVGSMIKLLNLVRGARILDLGCGAGRHSVELAKRGFDVTGLDLSAVLLKEAQTSAAKAGVNPRFIKRDMRQVMFEREFDTVLSLYTSFGYFDDIGNESVIKTVAKALKPQGQFFLDVWNKDHFIATLSDRAQPRKVEGGRLLQDYRYDPANSVIAGTKTLIMQGQRRVYRFFLRLYSPDEIVNLLQRHSLEVENVWGEYDGSIRTESSSRMIVAARKR